MEAIVAIVAIGFVLLLINPVPHREYKAKIEKLQDRIESLEDR